MTPCWTATCIQMPTEIVWPCADSDSASQIMAKNLDLAIDLIDQAMEAPAKPSLLLLPEYAFTGQPNHENVEEWLHKACRQIPGPLTEPLQAKAVQHRVYLGANQFEYDPRWGNRFFNTSYLIAPTGEIILRYRRVHTALWCSPHDLMDDYLEDAGREGLWPVVETELGRIGMVPCGEITVPEVLRTLTLRGAEVLLHPTWEVPTGPQDAAKIAGASANMVYILSTNVAASLVDGHVNDAPSIGSVGAGTRIIDYRGTILAERNDHTTVEVTATIDIAALRDARADLSLKNQLLRLRLETFAPTYAPGRSIYPPNSFADMPMRAFAEIGEPSEVARGNLEKLGVLTGTPDREIADDPT
jgi:predicted amidohydrolase